MLGTYEVPMQLEYGLLDDFDDIMAGFTQVTTVREAALSVKWCERGAT